MDLAKMPGGRGCWGQAAELLPVGGWLFWTAPLASAGANDWPPSAEAASLAAGGGRAYPSGSLSISRSTSSRWMMSQASLSVGVTFITSRRPLSSRLFSTAGVSSQMTKEALLS